MTFAYKNIKAFIYLLQNTPELFSTQDRQTIVDKIPEDIESISEILLAWCKQRPEINDTLRQVHRNLTDDEPQFMRGAGGTFPDAKTQAEDEKNLREALLNNLRQSSLPETPKPKTSKG